MSSRMTVMHTCAWALCEGVSEDSGTWYMMSRISFHGMTCRIPYRIGMFLLECDCEMGANISCAFRWEVALVRGILYWA